MNKIVTAHHEDSHGSVTSYSIGFVLSVVLTLVAYLAVTQQWAAGWALIFVLAGLAIVQLFVQLIFFLHLGQESRPRWNLSVLVFAAMIVFIIVFGSLWIMKSLSYNHDQGQEPQSASDIIKDEGYQP